MSGLTFPIGFGVAQGPIPAIAVGDIAAGGSIGAAAATVDRIGIISISQTTAGKALTLPTPSYPSLAVAKIVANAGSAGFFMYGRFLRPGSSHEFLYVPGVGWRRTSSSPQVIAQSGIAVTCPNDTAENLLFSMTIPGGVLGENGAIRSTIMFSYGGSTNVKRVRFKYDSTAFLNLPNNTASNILSNVQMQVSNNGEAAQKGYIASSTNHFGGGISSAATGTVNTAQDFVLAITGQKDAAAVSASDALVLERYTIELLRFD